MHAESVQSKAHGLLCDPSEGLIFADNAAGSRISRAARDEISRVLPYANMQPLGMYYPDAERMRAELQSNRSKVAQYLNASDPREVVFGPSATVLLGNLARAFQQKLVPGDEIIITNVDHHANIGPWEALEAKGIVLRRWNVRHQDWTLAVEDLEQLLTERTRVVAFSHCSNVLGTINPVAEVSRIVHEAGAILCVDGVAWAPHGSVDVAALGADFYVMSFYKAYGPHYAAMFGRYELLAELPGVNHSFISEDDVPYKFEPGNPNYELVAGSAASTDYPIALGRAAERGMAKTVRDELHAQKAGYDLMASTEEELSSAFLDVLSSFRGCQLFGLADADRTRRVSTFSFCFDDVDSGAVVQALARRNIALRHGSMYALRLYETYKLASRGGFIRASFLHYNTCEDVHEIGVALEQVRAELN